MKRGDRLWILAQGTSTVLAVLIVVTGIRHRMDQPLDRETLGIAVTKIFSYANETVVLLSERDARVTPHEFVQQHALQLEKLVSADVDSLARKPVPESLAEYKQVALTQGEALRKLLGRADGAATRESATEIAYELAKPAARLKPLS
jgi:hypothetical protein